MSAQHFRARAERQERDGIEVQVSVLTAQESRAHFGVPLYVADIQPVWISIENETYDPLWLMTPEVDTDYFSPSEAVYLSRYRWRRWRNRGVQVRFQREALRSRVPPRVGVSGFVFTNRLRGGKPVDIVLIGRNRRHTFSFLIELPGRDMDFHLLPEDRAAHFGGEPIGLEELQDKLRTVPWCVTNRRGTKEGDPINVVLVGSPRRAGEGLLRCGWCLTERTSLGSTWRTIRAFLLGKIYRHSPVSPLHAFGRRHDAALQKIRWSIHERNHLRTWRTPWLLDGTRHVHVIQVSRDIGVRLTRRTRILTTHKIDPDVDNARDAVVMDLARIGYIERMAWLRVGDPCSPSAPRLNLTQDPWWSDGLRAVVFLSDEPQPIEQAEVLDWDDPPPL